MCHVTLTAVAATLSFLPGAPAQTNSWTKATSGQWHEPHWSLGVLPDNTQNQIIITNSGWKSVAIDATTASDFPASLSISNLQVTSPPDSLNTLMLDYASLNSPLRVEHDFYLGSNAHLVALGSALRVGNQFVVDGTAYQDAFSDVTTKTLGLGLQSRATYHLSSGTLNANSLSIGFWQPWEKAAPPATFIQSGGTNRARGIGIHSGEYILRDGEATAAFVTVGYAGLGTLRQFGGRFIVNSNITLGTGDSRTYQEGDGFFELANGTFSTPKLQLGTHTGYSSSSGGSGFVVQSGGSNSVGSLVVGTLDSFSYNQCIYRLLGGTLTTTNTIVYTQSDFEQLGGVHAVDGPLLVRGAILRLSPSGAAYHMVDGIVRCHSLTLEMARFSQDWGTTEVSGDLVLVEESFVSGSSYVLNNGQLNTSNTVVGVCQTDGFTQRGGTHWIRGTLDLPPRTRSSYWDPMKVRYRLEAGLLAVNDIRVGSNSAFAHKGGRISHSGTLTLAGRWESVEGECELGRLRIERSITNSSLVFPQGSAVLQFADSSATAWDPSGTLVIHNWRGSNGGGGSHRILFGTNETSLTSQQLSQIRFRDPAGLPPGDYQAAILATGEIVPLEPTGRGPSIAYQQSASLLTMVWPAGYTLQSATNVLGPFHDLDTESPYTIDTGAAPRRFFRFRQ